MSLSWSPAEQGELDHQDQIEKGLRICCLWWRRCMCIYPLAPTWLVRVCSIRSSLPYTYWLAPPLERIGALCRFSLQGDGKQEMLPAENRCLQVQLLELIGSIGAGMSRRIKWVWSESKKSPIHSTGRWPWLRAWKKSISWKRTSHTRITTAWMLGCEGANRLHKHEITEQSERDF